MEQKQAVGRRKTSIARVYVTPGNGDFNINGKKLEEYFPLAVLQDRVQHPYGVTETGGKYDTKVNVKGGGINGQADAVAMAISRVLVGIDAEYRALLKPHDLLTRDPRMVERKKYGQKKARKSFQFSKR
ncbi:MAG: 30S ribosomal protein S9 [Bacteroidia bacterium]